MAKLHSSLHMWITAGSRDIKPEERQSMVIVSDELDHTKYSVYVFIKCVFRYLKTIFPNVKQINVFSDGPMSQFKQRFLFQISVPGRWSTT